MAELILHKHTIQPNIQQRKNMKEETTPSLPTQIYENLLSSISEYLKKQDRHTFENASRNLSLALQSTKKSTELLEGMKAGDKTQWAYFLARIVHSFNSDGSFERFKALSPFKDQVIAIAEFNSASFLLKTNAEFVRFMKRSKVHPDCNDYLIVFDPQLKITNVEIPRQ